MRIKMFIIWGFTQTEKELGFVGYFHCYKCNNDGNWQLKKVTNWFTIFFIPVIPFRRKYYVYCPVCHDATQVPKEEAKRIMENRRNGVV